MNPALASLDALYRCLELGRANVRRDKPAQAAPRALDEAGQRLLLRAAEAAPIRARALVMLMLFTALRISEAVALDVDDVRITTRKAVMGKGEMQRDVPLNALGAPGPRRVVGAEICTRARGRAGAVDQPNRRTAVSAVRRSGRADGRRGRGA